MKSLFFQQKSPFFLACLLWLAVMGSPGSVWGQTTIFYEDFETGTLNPTFWTANPGPVNGLAEVVNSTASCGGTYHLRLGKTADAGGFNTAYVDLNLNLSAYVDSQLALSFCIYDFFDETQAEDAVLASADNGASFFPLIDLTPTGWNDGVWGQRVPYDLDQLLVAIFGVVPSNLILRFQQRGSGNFSTSGDEDGIALDNVWIGTERRAFPATVPYYEDFESGVFDPEWILSSREAAGGTGPASGLNRFPRIGVVNSNTWSVSGSHSLWMGKNSDLEGANLNASDLYLTLGTYVDSQLSISFSITDFYDETSIYDGVYASEDNGVSFYKIIDFDPDNWYNYNVNPYFGRRVPYDLDQLLKDTLSCECVPDTLILRFQQYGTGDYNASGDEDGLFLDNLSIQVDRKPVYSTVPYSEDFESGVFDPEWILSSREAAGGTGPASGLNRFPRCGVVNSNTWSVSGSHSLWMGKNSDLEGANLNASDLYLTLGTYVDSQLSISFSITDFYDETSIYDGIYASEDNGVSFHKIIDFDPDNWYNYNTNPYFGRRVPYDLDKLLRENLSCECVPDTLILRFQQYGSGDYNASGDEDGLFLDDLSIQVDPSPVYATIPYFQGFESAVFDSEWKISSEKAVGQTTLSGNINQLNRFWRNEVYNTTSAVGGSYAMRMSKTTDIEGVNINAMDLHVNLQGESQVELKYYIYKFYDEQQIDDGIWLSVDAGASFSKIYDFDLANITTGVWTQQTLDLSALAAGLSTPLVFSDSTIIRFQQYGTGDLSTSGDEDGLSFDNVEINCLAQTADFSFNVDCSTLQVDFTDGTLGTNITTPFAWDFDGDGVVDTVANGSISYVYPGTGTYNVTLYVGNVNGCGDSITKQIFIGSSVPAPTISPLGPQVSLCDGETLTVAAQVGYQGYLWNTGATTPSIQITTPGIYSVRGLGIDGCYSVPTVLEVIARPAPAAPFISLVGEPVFCEGESVDLIAPLGASSYLWTTGATTQTITVTSSGTYGVQIANGFGCLSPSADTTITVNATPSTPVIAQGVGTNWLSSSSSGQSYVWFLNGVQVAADSQTIDASLFGNGSYTVQVANGNCESELSVPFAFTLTGLNDLRFSNFSLSPNPATGIFHLEGEQDAARALRVSVYNVMGQQVLSAAEVAPAARWSHIIDLSAQPEGIYQLRIETDGQMMHRQLVLQK